MSLIQVILSKVQSKRTERDKLKHELEILKWDRWKQVQANPVVIELRKENAELLKENAYLRGENSKLRLKLENYENLD